LRRGDVGNYIANLPANTDLRTLAATIKTRWICEQAHQQLKEWSRSKVVLIAQVAALDLYRGQPHWLSKKCTSSI
jgi:hypothetical protein